MMYKFGTTKRFDKALKLCKKRGYPIEELRKAIAILVENGSLPSGTHSDVFGKTRR